MTSTAAPTFLVTSGFWQKLPQMSLERVASSRVVYESELITVTGVS